MITEKQAEKGISNIIGALVDPIIVMPGGWGESLPDWIKTAITLERLCMNISALQGEEKTGTNAEATAYLYTACLTAPPSHDWAQIYLYVASKAIKKNRTMELPAEINVETLTDDQSRELRRLKDWLYRTRVKVRLEREKEQRKADREVVAVAKKQEQPALFEL